ncbi:Pentatricopeptide repeat-containing protein [Artemisia annua]|uniref:Pentatricopeptide repeat-containing protein n=1 Tax=Artemisia annua TaxID=35608 RepID=A0A2U1N044_ARTAN|nr:Pentatricopeptide repeat-containing protein [Artemisia annua]
MPLIRLYNHSSNPLFLPLNLLNYKWVSTFTPISNPRTGLSSVWFVKVVCTLYVRRNASLKKEPFSRYLRDNLDFGNLFSVVKYMSTNWNDPRLVFGFLEFSRDVLSVDHDIETYKYVIRSFCRVGDFRVCDDDMVILVNDAMRRAVLLLRGNEVLGFLITTFVDVGKFELAKRLVIEYDELVISCLVINRLLSALVRSSVCRVDEVVDFFENVVLRSRGCFVDACSFNIVISGLCRAREVDKAFKFYSRMKDFGCLPDSVTYNTLVNGFCRSGNVDKAHVLLREVCEVDGCSPNVVTFTSVISGYCKLGKMEEALVLFDNMIGRDIRPNTITFNVIIDGYGKTGNMNSLLNTYEKMLEFGCRPDVITFTSILDGYCRIGDLHKGLEIWDEMNRRNLYPNIYTFSILINTLCKEGRFTEARNLLRQLKHRGDIFPKAFIYNPVIDGFCKAGNLDEANLIVKEMEEKRCKLDKLTFTILIIGHCAKGRMVEAISLFDKMMIVGCAPDLVTVNSLVSRLLKAGMPKEAFEIRKVALGVRVPQTEALYRKNVDVPVAVTAYFTSDLCVMHPFYPISFSSKFIFFFHNVPLFYYMELAVSVMESRDIWLLDMKHDYTLVRVRKSFKSCLPFPERWWMQFPTTAFIRIYFYQKTWCWMGISTFLELAFPNSHQLIGKVAYAASVILQWKGWVVLLLSLKRLQ